MPVHYRQSRMCAECPFRTTSLAGWLGDDRPQDVIGILRADQPYHCHMDVAKAVAAKRPASSSAHCAGALQFMKSIAKLPRDRTAADAVRGITVEKDCLTNADAFLKHHAAAGKAMPSASKQAPTAEETPECSSCGGDITDDNPATECPECEGSLCKQCDVTHGCPHCGADIQDEDEE